MSSKPCSVENCLSRAQSKGLCAGHYLVAFRSGKTPAFTNPKCKMTGCESAAKFKELCGRHYQVEQRANVRRAKNQCAVKPCPVEVYREGHCKAHYVERYPKVQTRIPDCRRPGCTQPQFRLEGCERHWKNYQRNQLRKTLIPCTELGCQKLAGSNGKCKSHSKPAEHCLEDGCQSKVRSMGRCQLHYNQFKSAEDFPEDFWAFVKLELGIKA
jgi:hypothetical protein